MATFSANKILRGNDGRVWLDGERLANIKSFEAKRSNNISEVTVNGIGCTQHVPSGTYSLSGTMTLHKFDSFVLSRYADADTIPECTVVASLADPQSRKTQRVALYGVLFSETTLAQFENGEILEEEVPFVANGYEILNTI